jgi:hypothetical protein
MCADSTQTGLPVAQTIPPAKQGLFSREHSEPSSQGLHSPLRQTAPFPQGLPLARSFVVSMQVALPPVHTVKPMMHGFIVIVQGLPGSQLYVPGVVELPGLEPLAPAEPGSPVTVGPSFALLAPPAQAD